MGRKPNTKAKVRKVLDTLEERYGRARFVSRFDPVDELVSCILSQHTADANSFPAFTRLRATFPEWQQVVDAGPERVADVVRKAGLANQKARSIINALKEVHRRVGGYSLEPLRAMEMRDARDWLMSLPGVGPKTASIVLCFSFGMAAIPVDTHVFRVSKRLGFVPEGADEKKAHDLLLEVVEPEDAFRYHTTLIQHGRKTCRAQRPLCDE
ncbi:MAG TPA: endonuclease III, partial [Fimbriimonadaceae bacterium]|nr:endonuclease III [Fimbriimonadaceae bacterium]